MGNTTLFVYVGMLIVLTMLGMYTARVSFKNKSSSKQEWISNYAQGFSSGMVGAVVAGIALGLVILVVQTTEGQSTQRHTLILQMGSPSNDIAVEAARQLRMIGAFNDGSLEHAFLRRANLQNAQLQDANLQEVALLEANLKNTVFLRSNLRDALLMTADLQGAILQSANLQGANLEDANLENADLFNTKFDTSTRLPDGSLWTSDTVMERFTDPNHPNFWRSNLSISPAYHG